MYHALSLLTCYFPNREIKCNKTCMFSNLSVMCFLQYILYSSAFCQITRTEDSEAAVYSERLIHCILYTENKGFISSLI